MERRLRERWWECFDAMRRRDGGRGLKADFVGVGGSTANGESLVASMLAAKLIEAHEDGGQTYYTKTRRGEIFDLMRQDRDDLDPLFRLALKKRGRLSKKEQPDEDTDTEAEKEEGDMRGESG